MTIEVSASASKSLSKICLTISNRVGKSSLKAKRSRLRSRSRRSSLRSTLKRLKRAKTPGMTTMEATVMIVAVVVAREAETVVVTTAETTDATILIRPTSRSSPRHCQTHLTAREATVTVAAPRVKVEMTAARDARVATRRGLSLSKSPSHSSRLAFVPALRSTSIRVSPLKKRKRMMAVSSRALKISFKTVKWRMMRVARQRSVWKRS